MSDVFLNLNNIAKRYPQKVLFEHIDLAIHKGEVIAITGKNGSGKTTLLEIIIGKQKVNLGNRHVRKHLKIQYVAQLLTKPSRLTTLRYLTRVARKEGLNAQKAKQQILSLLRDFDLSEVMNYRLKKLSVGALKRLALVKALLVKPDLLVIDDPLSAQDNFFHDIFLTQMQHYLDEGGTIVLVCYDNDILEQLATTVLDLSQKRLSTVYVADKAVSKNTQLQFFKPTPRLRFPDYLQKLTEKIEIRDQLIHIKTTRENSQKVIIEMLSRGFELRGMSDE